MIPPGETIGILGGGQLGKMLAMAAAQLGYRCQILAPEAESVAADVSHAFTQAEYDDAEALARFASTCSVVTYEFENVPVAPLLELSRHVPLHPSLRALEVAQDRLSEKLFVTDLGGTTAPFAAVDTPEDLASAMRDIGTPGILKTRRDGYDGKGQFRVMNAAEGEALTLPDAALIYEGFVDFFAEFSVILCRGTDGEVVFWDTPQNKHEDGILALSQVPAMAAIQPLVAQARALAQRIAEALEYVGVLTCEFFATDSGPVLNEIAPRVHNSGHWTIEGARTSQFENHIRAVCGLPLGDTALTAARVEMRNLIGDEANDWPTILSDPANSLHLYGKGEAREGRKMGHVTRLTLG